MTALGRQKAAAERAAAAVQVDALAVRAARERATAVLRERMASPGFILAAFATGLATGAVVAPSRRSERDQGARPEGAEAHPSGGMRFQQLAMAAAGLLRLIDFYIRRS